MKLKKLKKKIKRAERDLKLLIAVRAWSAPEVEQHITYLDDRAKALKEKLARTKRKHLTSSPSSRQGEKEYYELSKLLIDNLSYFTSVKMLPFHAAFNYDKFQKRIGGLVAAYSYYFNKDYPIDASVIGVGDKDHSIAEQCDIYVKSINTNLTIIEGVFKMKLDEWMMKMKEKYGD